MFIKDMSQTSFQAQLLSVTVAADKILLQGSVTVVAPVLL